MSTLNRRLKAIVSCKACPLHRNQCPLIDKRLARPINVCWVGLSAKLGMSATSRPLSEDTRSGAIIAEVEQNFPTLGFYRSNLVKCPPVLNDKLRYPTQKEMATCAPHIVTELSRTEPELVILLGRQVIDFFSDRFSIAFPSFAEDFVYRPVASSTFSSLFVGIHHPSFINVYRHKRLEEYTSGISQVISNVCEVASLELSRS